MEILRGHTVRILPEPEQEAQLRKAIGCNRFLWNQLIEMVKDKFDGENPGRQACERRLMELKREYPWMYDAPAQSLQQTIRDLDQGFRTYEKVKGRPGIGEDLKPPHCFKKRGQGESFRVPQRISLDELRKRIHVSKIGDLRARQSLDFPGELRSVTIRLENDKWYAVLLMRSEVEPEPTPEYLEKSVGIDRGIVHFAATNGGDFLDMPDLKPLYEKLAGLQAFLKRKKYGSREYRKLQQHIRDLSRHIAAVRRDFLHKSSTNLAKSHGLVILEDLKVKPMMASAKGTVENPGKIVKQKRGLNREIGKQCWSTWRFMLGYKLAERGGKLVLVSARNSSLECSACGHVAKGNRRSQARFECMECGHEENADVNAAKVLRGRAMSRNGLSSCRCTEAGAWTQVPSGRLILA